MLHLYANMYTAGHITENKINNKNTTDRQTDIQAYQLGETKIAVLLKHNGGMLNSFPGSNGVWQCKYPQK